MGQMWVKWEVPWPEYAPEDFTSPAATKKPWADTQDPGGGNFKWNDNNGPVNRRSYLGTYKLDSQHRPLNPMGRTGIRGRGVLGRWGPNHAADPIVSRIFNGQLQFVAIRRFDCNEWAIPGGMVDAEALDGRNYPELDELWCKGVELYRGYVDDPRNTDNAWIETLAVNFHDADGIFEKNNVSLKSGDDAKEAKWINAVGHEKLYASHGDFIKLLVEHHNIQ
ncbi:unnamed protein product [Gongylonema pulchrum]|uniref:Nudix hydrolase domain-containing protein n=1 Tax=Gongylonema pulchrum TaxID=637853 RepID=A0A183DTD3_9BILA|nr:unnamed protein product [Gongylonema pulchrum]